MCAQVYRADGVTYSEIAEKKLAVYERLGYGKLPAVYGKGSSHRVYILCLPRCAESAHAAADALELQYRPCAEGRTDGLHSVCGVRQRGAGFVYHCCTIMTLVRRAAFLRSSVFALFVCVAHIVRVCVRAYSLVCPPVLLRHRHRSERARSSAHVADSVGT